MVHVGLFLAPLSLEGVGGEELGLRAGALVREARGRAGNVRGQLHVLLKGGEELRVGGGYALVGAEREGVEEGGIREDVGQILGSSACQHGAWGRTKRAFAQPEQTLHRRKEM